MLANSDPLVLGYSLASKLPTAASWRTCGRPACWRIPVLWCWDIRLPASFPQRLRGRSVGGQLAGEFRSSGVGIFACQQASHSGFVVDPWEASLLASSGPLVLGYSLASKLPTAASWRTCGRPACWRIPVLWCWDIRLPASFPQRLRGRSVGGQLAGEFRSSGVGIFACQQASHSGFVVDPWEASLLASSGPLVLGYSLASKLPTAASWRTCGRPACWRIPVLWCWDIRLPASFPQRLRGGPVGDPLASEFRPSGVGIFACQQASHSGFVADPWEASLLANSGPLVLGYSLASKLPTAASWRIRGRPAC